MLVVGIPSGQRLEQAKKVIAAWQKQPVKIALLTWDKEYEQFRGMVDFFILDETRKSFAVNHNRMMKEIAGWQGYICGADDLYPGTGTEKSEKACRQYDGKLLWVFDGLTSAIMTHPVVTRQYFDEKGPVFDERYTHCFCDTDLCKRAQGDILKLRGVQFDHQWRKHGYDPIYQIGSDSFAEDKKKFLEKFGTDVHEPIQANEVYV